MDTAGFLATVWPAAPGLRYCITAEARDASGKKQFFNKWSSDVAKAAKQADRLAAQGYDVYHCCAVFPADTKRRTNQNVHSTRALYLDLDVHRPGSAKPNTYPTQHAALAALQAFLQASGMAAPNLITSSGWGLHVYWVLDTALTYNDWRPLAHGLRNLAVQHGMHFDEGVTVTLSRVLRTPNTWNFKNREQPQRTAVLGWTGQWVSLAAVRGLLLAHQGAAPAMAVGPAAHGAPLGGPSDLSANMHQRQRPSSMGNIIQQCPVMREMFLKQGAMGGWELWRDTISLAAHCDDGHLIIDHMSRGYHNYDPRELERQWAYAVHGRQQGTLGPARCMTFAGVGGQGHLCATCPHNGRLTSPMQLAYDPPQAPPPPVATPAAPGGSNLLAAPSPGDPPPASQAPVSLPHGHAALAHGGITATVWDKDSECYSTVQILAGRISRIERRREEVRTSTGRSEGVVLVVQYHASARDHAGTTIRLPVGALNLKNDALLGGLGFIVTGGRHREVMQMFRSWSDELAAAASAAQTYSRYGWVEHDGKHGFVLGDRAYWPGRHEQLMTPLPGAATYKTLGTLDGWRAAAQIHLDHFTMPLVAAVASSFAAPLVALSGRRGGRLLSIVGDQSGTGKSTALDVAQSVWGDNVTGTLRMNATINAVPEFAKTLHSLPVFWDEARGVDGPAFMNLMFSIVEGRGRMRLNANAELKDTAHWHNMVTIASNFSARDIAAEGETVAGEGPRRARVFECTMPPGLQRPVPGLHRYTAACDENRGHAGHAYVRYLVDNRDTVVKLVQAVEDGLTAEIGAPSVARFHISTMALLLIGAQIATHIGLLHFDVAQLKRYLLQEYRHMTTEGMASVVQTLMAPAYEPPGTATALTVLEAFLSQHSSHLLVTHEAPLPGRPGRPQVQRHIAKRPIDERMPVVAQIILNQNLLVIDRPTFYSWLVKTGRARAVIMAALTSSLGARTGQRSLAQGTPWSRMRTFVVEIELNKHQELLDFAGGLAASSNTVGWTPPALSPVPAGATVH